MRSGQRIVTDPRRRASEDPAASSISLFSLVLRVNFGNPLPSDADGHGYSKAALRAVIYFSHRCANSGIDSAP